MCREYIISTTRHQIPPADTNDLVGQKSYIEAGEKISLTRKTKIRNVVRVGIETHSRKPRSFIASRTVIPWLRLSIAFVTNSANLAPQRM